MKKLDFSKVKLLVVGDYCTDIEMVGEVTRISPEAPVPVLENPTMTSSPGMIGNVFRNIMDLGGKAHLIQIVGNLENTYQFKDLTYIEEIAYQSKDVTYIEELGRRETIKTRYKAGRFQLLRVDNETDISIKLETEDRLISAVKKQLRNCDGVILSDYGKGVLTWRVVKAIIDLADEKKVIIDPHKSADVWKYKGASLLTPNYEEAKNLMIPQFSICKSTLITRSADGMVLYDNSRVYSIPSAAEKVVDVTGAGDTVTAAISLAWISGMSLVDAMKVSNYAAAVVVGKQGTATCSIEELKKFMRK